MNYKEYTVRVYQGGSKEWRKDGLLHREDGPAYEGARGTKEWRKEGRLHREDGPAYVGADGTKQWYKDGKLHRMDGPAHEGADGIKYWWINGVELTKEQFNDTVRISKNITYPVYMRSYNKCESGVLAVKFTAERDFTFYFRDNSIRSNNDGCWTVETLTKAYGYFKISEKEFNDLTKPVEKTAYPYYLISNKEKEKAVLAVKFTAERDTTFYMKNGCVQKYNKSCHTVESLIKDHEYYVINEDKFNQIISTITPVSWYVDCKEISEEEFNGTPKTSCKISDKVIEIEGKKYKLTEIL